MGVEGQGLAHRIAADCRAWGPRWLATYSHPPLQHEEGTGTNALSQALVNILTWLPEAIYSPAQSLL